MPPKNMISVPRNHHMPSEAALRCCCSSAKWCRSSGRSSCSIARGVSLTRGLSLKRHLFRQRHFLVFVRFPSHFRSFVEVEGWWWRRGPPLEACCLPGIVFCDFAIAQRPQQVRHWQEISNRKDGRTRSRKHVQHLKFRRILPVAPRHSQISENELRKECQVETEEHDKRGK